MNGFQSFGRGISSHETSSTSGKKIANSTVGKIILAQLFLLVWAAPAVAIGPCEAQAQLPPAHHKRGTGRAPFAIGDSVMLGAATALAQAGFRVDARGCRQMEAGVGNPPAPAGPPPPGPTGAVAPGTERGGPPAGPAPP